MARILVIEDDPGMREMIEEMAKGAGHDVSSAPDGLKGVQTHRARPVDLVITDLLMPNKEGLETIIDLRREFPATAILAMTGATYAGVLLETARRLGATRTIEKPFQPRELLTAIEETLAQRRH